MDFQDLLALSEVLEKTTEGWYNVDPANSLLLLVVFTSVPILVKIDREMRSWEWALMDRQTDAQTQTGFIVCPMLHAIAIATWAVHNDSATRSTNSNQCVNNMKVWNFSQCSKQLSKSLASLLSNLTAATEWTPVNTQHTVNGDELLLW